MPTIPFTNAGPEPSHTVSQMLAAIKLNAQFIRNMVALMGVQGFNYSWTGGTAQFPTTQKFIRSTETITVTTTYVTSSGGNYIPTTQTITHPDSAGATNTDIVTYSYNSDDILISTTWSTV